MELKRLAELAGISENPAIQAAIQQFGGQKKKEESKPEDEEKKDKQSSDNSSDDSEQEKGTNKNAVVNDENEEKKQKSGDDKDTFDIVVATDMGSGTPPVSIGGVPDGVIEPAVTDSKAEVPATSAVPQQDSGKPATQFSPSEVVKLFFNTRDQIHYYHLQTDSYAEHKALNDFYETILEVADKFLEAFQGVHGRAQGDVSFQLKNYSKDVVTSDIHNFANNIRILQTQVKANSDMVNLLDELLNSCNKTLYLLTLK